MISAAALPLPLATPSHSADVAAVQIQAKNDPRQQTVKLLKSSIDQTHELLSLLNQIVLAASAAQLAAGTGGLQPQAVPVSPSFMPMIELTMKILCSQQGAFTAACSIPAAGHTAEHHETCRQEADQLRIRLASALAQVESLRAQFGQPFYVPTSPPAIPEYRSAAAQIRSRKRQLPHDHQSPQAASASALPLQQLDHRIEPVEKRQKLPMPPLAVPPPAKPHGFPPKLAIYSKNYTNTRYTETGRLALSVPSTTVLAHALVPPRQLPPQTRQNYAAAIVASVITSSQPMATVLNAIASRSSPCTIHELFDKCNQNSETRPAEWSKIAMRWSVRPMVPVHVLDPRQSELAAPWRSMLESLSPAEAEYVQGKNPRMVLMVGVEWVGYPEGMFADSPSPDGQSTRVGLVERYGLVVGDLGRLPAAAKPPPRTLPVLSFGPFPALPRLGSRPANPVGLPIPAAGSAANIASSSLSDSGGSDLDDNDEEGGWEVYVDGGYVRVDSASDDNIGGSGSDSESLTDIDVDLESTAMDGNPPSQHQQRQAHGLQPNEARTLVGTPSALLTFMSRRRRIGRYIHGQIRVHGRVTAIVNELVAPRAWTTEQLDIYLAAVIADAGNGLVARVLAFAFRRGPMRPFSLNDLVEGVPVQVQEGSTARKRLRIALSRCVVCPLHVVDRLPREGNGEVWDRLVSAVAASGGNEVPQSATLGVMAGVELVGFETPRPGDEIPPCHARRFVVRERYAILV